MVSKIDYAIGATTTFINHLHRENLDRGMITTFGDHFYMDQAFTGNEALLHHALAKIPRTARDSTTHLYDGLEAVIGEFWRTGQQNRPWLLIAITDGKDNFIYGKYYRHPDRMGRYIADSFNDYTNNFVFVLGVGEGDQIDSQALATMGTSGNFLAMKIQAFPLLEAVFLRIALQVVTTIAGITVTAGATSWTEIARLREITHVALDYAFLIDRSLSMQEPG